MEKRKFQVCQTTFPDVSSLEGHKKSYLFHSTSPRHRHRQLLVQTQVTDSSSSEHKEDANDQDESPLAYKLRENPKRSFKVQDPELSSSTETESGREVVLSRTRSKRKKGMIDLEQISSVSCPSPEEDLAMCLMLLSRDACCVKPRGFLKDERMKKTKKKVVSKRGGKFICSKCMKRYRSSRALLSHKKICSLDANELVALPGEKIFECPYCFKLFGSGQALGGHKRSHLLNHNTPTTDTSKHPANSDVEETEIRPKKCSFLDLNLPASPGDDFGVVLEADEQQADSLVMSDQI